MHCIKLDCTIYRKTNCAHHRQSNYSSNVLHLLEHFLYPHLLQHPMLLSINRSRNRHIFTCCYRPFATTVQKSIHQKYTCGCLPQIAGVLSIIAALEAAGFLSIFELGTEDSASTKCIQSNWFSSQESHFWFQLQSYKLLNSSHQKQNSPVLCMELPQSY